MVFLSLISALRRLRQEYLCEFEPNLVYIVSSSLPGLHSETLSENQNQNQTLRFYVVLRLLKRKEGKEGGTYGGRVACTSSVGG